jgi:hypothetical protein
MAKSRARFLAELLGTDGLVKKAKSALAGADEVLDLDTLPTIPNSKLQNATISIAGHSTALGGSVTLNTGNIGEHINYKYFTDARARAAVSVSGDLGYNSSTGVFSFTERTDAEILTAIKTVDGSGSGLDADLLDGQHGSYYTNASNLGNGTVPDARLSSNVHFVTTNASTPGNGNLSIGYDGSTYSYVQSHSSKPLRLNPAGNAVQIGSGNTVWHAGNDGSGSGLDADLLDGQEGSYYRAYANLTGTPTIPSLSGYATESYVGTQISNLVDSSPAALNTLNELAAALGDDANFSTTITTSIGTKLPLAGGALTGAVTTNSTFDGRNVSVDGAKLDGIETGATADQTAAEILTAIKTVDGSGSGLDADTVDGTHKSGFFVQSGSWLGDLGSNGYTRENGLTMTGGSEFTLLSKGGQGTVLVDGQYISYEGSNGFFGSYNASYANAAGIRATAASTVTVQKLNGNNASLAVTGNITRSGNTVWDAGNDGSGSGLDADLLDGQHGSYYYSAANLPPKIKAGGTGPSTENLNSIANSVSTGQLEYRGFNSSSSNAPPVSDNANGVITVGQHSGNYNAQLAFSSNGNMYWRDNPSSNFGSWRTVWDSANDGSGSGLDADLLDGQQGSYYYAASNPSGYTSNVGDITGVTAGTGMTGGGTTGTPTLNVIGGDGITANADNITVDSTVFRNNTAQFLQFNTASTEALTFKNSTSGGLIQIGFQQNDTDGMHHRAYLKAWKGSTTASGNVDLIVRGPAGSITSDVLSLRSGNASPTWRGQAIWNAGNDGASSGLDADLLDGQEGSYYLNYNNFTNTPTIPTNNNQLTNGAGYTTYTANQALNTTNSPTFANINTTNTGYVGIGDDVRLKDVSAGNTFGVVGQQNADRGFISFGSSITALGRIGTGQLTWGGDEIYHEGHKPTYSELGTMAYSNLTGTPTIPSNNNQLTNGAGYTTYTANQALNTTSTPTFAGMALNSDITFSNSGTTKRGIRGTMADNDMWFVGGGATASNAGYMEIAIGDDGQTSGSAEQMYFSQYGPGSPWSGTLYRRHAMFDENGQTIWNAQRTPTTVTSILSDASIVINTRSGSHNYIQLRNDSDDGTHAGLVFTDNNHGGSVLFTNHSTTENTANRADTLHLSGYQGVDIRSGTGDASVPSNKTRVARFATAAIILDKPTSVSGNLGITGSFTCSTSNTTGGGIILADDGDIVDLNDAYCSMRFSYGVRIYSGNKTGTAQIALKNNGEIIANSNITAYGSASDERLKENIETIKDPIKKVQQLRGVTFDYKKDGSKSTGLIAQELEKVLPEVVYETVDVDNDNNKYKAVRYGNTVGLLVEAIKEQQEQIEELKQIINTLVESK